MTRSLKLFEQAREAGEMAFDGPHHLFQETGFHPVPDSDRPKIWVGGRSGPAFRRGTCLPPINFGSLS